MESEHEVITILGMNANNRTSGGSVVKNPPANARDTGSIPWVRKIPWRSKWQPTPVLLSVKPHGQRSLEVYSQWGHKRVGQNLEIKQ